MEFLEKRIRGSVFERILGRLENAVEMDEADQAILVARLERVRALGGAYGKVAFSERLAAGMDFTGAGVLRRPLDSMSA